MINQLLEAVWICPPIGTHPAWVDQTTATIATVLVRLTLAQSPMVQVAPCEVEIPGAYPALGIKLQEVSEATEMPAGWPEDWKASTQIDEIQKYLPATISEVRVWDALGEGPDSAVQLVLATGLTLTVRHQYPPMTLGVDLGARSRTPDTA